MKKDRGAAPTDVTDLDEIVRSVLAWLQRHGRKQILDDMGTRYGIFTDRAFGVQVGALRRFAKELGPNHQLALALWDTGWYEARMLATFVAEPDRVTLVQMERWCRDFDNWSICDTACFHLFDRTPHAWRKIEQWSTRRGEFQKRAAFALLASLALHNKDASDDEFIARLTLIEEAAGDDRNFVKKGVVWALKGVGHRSPRTKAAATKVARRLAGAGESAPRWVGKEALRDLTRKR